MEDEPIVVYSKTGTKGVVLEVKQEQGKASFLIEWEGMLYNAILLTKGLTFAD